MENNTKNNSAPDNTAIFFTETNYGGSAHPYEKTASAVVVPSDLNDDFLSVQVGINTKVYVWQDKPDYPSNSAETTVDDPDLTRVNGISWLSVADFNTNGIYVKFVNNIPGNDNVYRLILNISEHIGGVNIPSNLDEYALAGIINDEASHITQVVVQDSDGATLPNDNGSCFFKEVSGDIICDEGENFPTNMSVAEPENGYFIFSIDSL